MPSVLFLIVPRLRHAQLASDFPAKFRVRGFANDPIDERMKFSSTLCCANFLEEEPHLRRLRPDRDSSHGLDPLAPAPLPVPPCIQRVQ
ncbi:unnamed protein product, partial [Iphiclides podalirius]